jgi:hypothetical protein
MVLRVFRLWREGVLHALDGGLWLHPFELRGERWAHLVSADRDLLLGAGRHLAMRPEWLQYRPLKHPRTWRPHPAWHWDLRGWRLEQALEQALALAPASPPAAARTPRFPRSA